MDFTAAGQRVLGNLLLAVVFLVGCQSLESQPTSQSPLIPVLVQPGVSPAGSFLAGRFAQNADNPAQAAVFFQHVLQSEPNNELVLQRALVAQMSAGAFDQAVPVAERLVAITPELPMARLLLAVEAFHNQDYVQAEAHLTFVGKSNVSNVLFPLIQGWAQAGQGRHQEGIARIDQLVAVSRLTVIGGFHKALILNLAGQPKPAQEIIDQLIKEMKSQPLQLVRTAASIANAQGNQAQAIAYYNNWAETNLGNASIEKIQLDAAKGRFEPIFVQNASLGVAQAFYDVAAGLRQETSRDTAIIYTRMALHLAPDFFAARQLLGELLEDDQQFARAIEEYRKINKDAPESWTSRLAMAVNLADLERVDEAVTWLQEMVSERPTRSDAAATLGEVYRAEEKFEKAAEMFSIAVDRSQPWDRNDWRFFYSRGISYERAQRWPEAEKDFLKALELYPDHPLVLNYLGYSWVDQGQRIDEALGMIEKAVAQRPNDGFIVDSLGWAFYKLKRYDEAVVYMERAIELTPDDPTINDHLGDVYWEVGRRLEAKFQWRRALLMKPEAKEIPKIQEKLDRAIEALHAGLNRS